MAVYRNESKVTSPESVTRIIRWVWLFLGDHTVDFRANRLLTWQDFKKSIFLSDPLAYFLSLSLFDKRVKLFRTYYLTTI